MSFHRDRMSAEDFWDFDLPISRRGRYFHDSSFADTRSDFDRKVRDILREWGDGDLLGDRWADDDDDINLSRYRKLRSRNLSDDNQAVTVTSKDDAHKIVLDVMDFVAGDVKVKVVGELELLVEGRLEAGTEGGTTRTFRRRFDLPPHTDMDAITSVLSQDGILTINAPKKGSKRKEETGGGSRGSADSRREHAATSSREEVRSRSGQSDLRDVPFKKMGRFFDDSEFEDSRWDFDRKVRDILRQWGDEDLLGDKWAEDDDDRRHTSNLSRYRKLRSRNLTDDNQAVAVTSRDDAHKIVLDVMDFVSGDVKVKVVGDYELLVEGRLEAGAEGGNARTFRRRFELPPFADIDAIMSVMSQDGILTITVPKKGSRGRSEGAGIQTSVNRGRMADSSTSASHAASSNTSSISSKVSSEVQQSERLGAASKKELSQSSQSVQASTPASAPQVKAESQQTSQNVSFSKEVMSEATPSDSQVKAVRSEEDKSKQQASQVQNSSQVSQKVVRSEDHGGRRRIALPITTRGQFFNDSFFESNWKNYQDAVRDVLARWDDRSSSVAADDMTCYRKLRTRDMRDENQAISTSEDETSYKFVVDVHDFTEDGGEVTVNMLEEGQLVVEGRVERRDGGAVVALKHFRREFTLPLNVRQQDITAVMSSDGVLTVIAPKQKADRPALTQESVSVSKQEGEVKQTQTAAAETVKVSADSQVKEQSHSTATAGVTQGSSSAALESQKEGETIIIPVEIGQSTAASQQEKKVTIESQVNFNDDENYKKSAAGKDLAFGDGTETDAAHRRLGEQQQQQQQEGEKTAMVKRRVKREFDDAYKNRLLPIKAKGRFCEDDLFADYQDSFMTAVKDILNKFREPSGKAGALDAYRGLRQRDLKLENQATHVEDNPHSQKVVVDVLDFLDGEVTAEVVDGKELVIKGHAQRREGSSLTTLTFVKPILIPEEANLEAISAFVSADGVLVLNIPKLEEQYELVDLTKMSPIHRPRLSTPVDSGGRASAERNVKDTSVDLQGKVYSTSTPRDPDRL